MKASLVLLATVLFGMNAHAVTLVPLAPSELKVLVVTEAGVDGPQLSLKIKMDNRGTYEYRELGPADESRMHQAEASAVVIEAYLNSDLGKEKFLPEPVTVTELQNAANEDLGKLKKSIDFEDQLTHSLRSKIEDVMSLLNDDLNFVPACRIDKMPVREASDLLSGLDAQDQDPYSTSEKRVKYIKSLVDAYQKASMEHARFQADATCQSDQSGYRNRSSSAH